MKIVAPQKSLEIEMKDIHENIITLENYQGKNVMLCFFRDAACPFCNLRLYELTLKYHNWKNDSLEIIAVFSSNKEDVKKHIDRHPRPFTIISDPELTLYRRFGVEHSSMAMIKAMMFKLPRLLKGLVNGGKIKFENPHARLVSADFLINTKGIIEKTWYGRNTGDHIPMKRIEQFLLV